MQLTARPLVLVLVSALALASACTPPPRCTGRDCEAPPSGCQTDAECPGGRCSAGACVAVPRERVLDACFTPAGGGEQCASGGMLTVDLGSSPLRVGVGGVVKLRSRGSAAVTISGLERTGASDFALTLPALPAAIASTASLDLPVVFTPTATGAQQATVLVSSDDPAQPHLTLRLGGTGTAACALAATPALLPLSAAVGEPVDGSIELRNDGNGSCTVTELAFVAGSSAAFRLLPTTLPFALGAGGTKTVQVRFTPPAIGTERATLRAFHSGEGASTLDVLLEGTGTAAPVCTLGATPGTAPGTAFQLDFGTFEVGWEKALPITLTNSGTAPCAITNARIVSAVGVDASSFSVRSVPQGPLAPGASATVEILFRPTSVGTVGARPPAARSVALFLDTGDTRSFPAGRCAMAGSLSGPAGCVAWGLVGTATEAVLRITPLAVDFGQVPLACNSQSRTVTLENRGTTPITVNSLSLSPTTSAFVPTAVPMPPFTIQPGTTAQYTGRFEPTALGLQSATLLVATNVPAPTGGTRTYQVSLQGTGLSSAPVREVFVQPVAAKVDVLWVIDDSGSMSEEQDAVAALASRFVDAANRSAADYHLGVVTTDMDDPKRSGRLQGSPRFVVPSSSAAAQFTANVQALDVNGSGNEQGLLAMQRALSSPLVTDASANAGFLRSDARLMVIVVSDEEDYSPGTAASYATFLDGLKGPGRAGDTSLSAIVGDPAPSQNSYGAPGCASSNGSADAGTRYLAVQAQTGGRFGSVCAADWTAIVDALAQDAFGLPTSVPLSGNPDPASLVVKVNGAVAPSAAWSYSAATRSIVFVASAVPPGGSTITVDYRPACP